MQSSNKMAYKLGMAITGVLAASAAGAFDMTSGDWKFSVNGNVNVDYIYSSCQSAASAEAVTGGLACVGSASGSSVSNVGNGLLPAAFTFGVSTTQNGIDLAAHLGLYPGIATNDGGSPNLQSNGGADTNTGLGTTGLDVRQVFMTFGNKEMGTFTLGRNFGLFGFDAIINDMTLPGVGVAGSASGPTPSNTTLGSIGFGYIYVDTLAQIDYTTPDVAGFNFTIGIFDPLNSLTDTDNTAKKAPGIHGKATYTLKFSDDMSFYASVTGISQKQNASAVVGAVPGAQIGTSATGEPIYGPPVSVYAPYQYSSNGGDVFVKFDVAGFELDASYYYGKGMGTTALFFYADDGFGNARKSDGYLIQGTYKIGAVKLGVNYGVSKLDYANAADAAANPTLLQENSKVTGGIYYSLTKNLTLLGEVTGAKAQAHNGDENKSTDVNLGAFLSF
ncbi:MAG: porin [Steroidobacteraceae bacterium]|jgi:predicted porin